MSDYTRTSPLENENSTVKVRKPLPYLFEKELIEKQNKQIKIVFRKFLPTEKLFLIEDKFYSKNKQDDLKMQDKYLEYVESLYRRPQDKYSLPLLESQTYGWIPYDMDRKTVQEMNDIYAPKRRCDLTVYGEKFTAERITQRPPFNGLRFFLR